MRIDGQCHCGYVTYEAEIEPDRVSICHCTDCQQLTGSAFRVTASTNADKIRLTSNPPKLYTKHGQNGRPRRQYFCPECGSALFTSGEGDAAAIWGIRVGTINQRRMLRPSRQLWCQSSLPWVTEISEIAGVQQDD